MQNKITWLFCCISQSSEIIAIWKAVAISENQLAGMLILAPNERPP
jgi:hypothetical protein